jgi:hypothetical protein
LLAYLVNERFGHAHPDAAMLTMADPSGTDGTPAVVTDGGGTAETRCAINADLAQVAVSRHIVWAAPERSFFIADAPVFPAGSLDRVHESLPRGSRQLS